VEKRN
jgi:hypothetical protein